MSDDDGSISSFSAFSTAAAAVVSSSLSPRSGVFFRPPSPFCQEKGPPFSDTFSALNGHLQSRLRDLKELAVMRLDGHDTEHQLFQLQVEQEVKKGERNLTKLHMDGEREFLPTVEMTLLQCKRQVSNIATLLGLTSRLLQDDVSTTSSIILSPDVVVKEDGPKREPQQLTLAKPHRLASIGKQPTRVNETSSILPANVSAEDLLLLPTHQRKGMSVEKLNRALFDISNFVQKKHRILNLPASKLTPDHYSLQKMYQEKECTHGRNPNAFSVSDLKYFSYLRNDTTSKGILTALRSLGRLDAASSGGVLVYVVVPAG